MASVRPRGDKWQARIKRNGITLERTFTARKDAERWGRSTEADIEAGRYQREESKSKEPDAPPLTVADLFDRYGKDVAAGHRSETTTWNLATLGQGLGAIRVQSINAAIVAKWRDVRLQKVAPASVARELATLNAVLEHARREWCIDVPVCAVKKPVQPRGRVRRLLPGEQSALVSTLAERYGRVVTFALETAMRRGEILGLQWRHVDMAARTALLPLTKNGDGRTVPLSPAALEMLRKMRQGTVQAIDGPVFDIHPQALDRAWRTACRKCGCGDLHFHDLRREAVTRLLERGLSVSEVSAISGHKTLAMLQRYTALRPEDIAVKLATST